MTVVPSLISQPAVPSHRRMICPLFALLRGFCPATAQIKVVAKAKDANADFRIGKPPRSRIRAKSSFACQEGQRSFWNKLGHQLRKGENKSRPVTKYLLNSRIVRHALPAHARSTARTLEYRETAPPPLSLLTPS